MLSLKSIANGRLFKERVIVTAFETCLLAGNPAMESHPSQCRHQGTTYVEVLYHTQN